MAGADFKSVDQEPFGGRLSALCQRSRFGRVRVGKDGHRPDIDEHAAQLRAGIAIINAAIEGKIKLVGTPCARWQTEAHLLRLTGHRIAIGSLIPFERSLSPFVDEAYGQNAEKDHHRPEAESPDLAE